MAFTVLTGIACGLLTGSVVLVIQGRGRPVAGSQRVVRIISGLAAVLLVSTVCTIILQSCHEALSDGDDCWVGVRDALLDRSLLLVLMAAVTAVPRRMKRADDLTTKTIILLLLIPLILSTTALLAAPHSDKADPRSIIMNEAAADTVRLIAIVVCSAAGARSLADSLLNLATLAQPFRQSVSSMIGYGGLTIVVGGTVLANLLLRGSPWGMAADEIKIGAAWLAWSAAWLVPWHSSSRQALNALGSCLLLIAVIL